MRRPESQGWAQGLSVSSLFVALPETQWVASNALAFAIRERYPMSRGHSLVTPAGRRPRNSRRQPKRLCEQKKGRWTEAQRPEISWVFRAQGRNRTTDTGIFSRPSAWLLSIPPLEEGLVRPTRRTMHDPSREFALLLWRALDLAGSGLTGSFLLKRRSRRFHGRRTYYATIVCRRRSASIGLTRCSSNPALRARSRSSRWP